MATQATTPNVWQHIAFVRSSGSLRTFVDGLSTSLKTGFTLNIQCTYGLTIGGEKTGNGDYFYYGYMDELRVSRYARYVANTLNTTALSIRDNGTIADFFSQTSYGVFGAYTAGQYLAVDFGEIRTITTTTYKNGAGAQWAPTQVLIQSSDDNYTWTTQATYSDNGTNNLQTITSTGSGRYWRMYQNTATRQAASGYEWHFGNFSMSGTFTPPTQAFSNIGPI